MESSFTCFDILQAGFFKSSAKITLHPKPVQRPIDWSRSQTAASHVQTIQPSSIHNGSIPDFATSTNSRLTPGSGSSISKSSGATWICTICSFANPVPSNFDPVTAHKNMILPPCLSCGIKPSFAHIMKAAISSAAGRGGSELSSSVPTQPLSASHIQCINGQSNGSVNVETEQGTNLTQQARFQCPRCTFQNHPSLLTCEICGLSLLSSASDQVEKAKIGNSRLDSPGPMLDGSSRGSQNDLECIKISFRAGGEKVFHERLKGAMIQRKWLLQNSTPPPDAFKSSNVEQNDKYDVDGRARPLRQRARTVGIAGLERQGLELRKKNEAVIGSAFEDLDALMASAKEIIALAETFAKKSDGGTADTNQIIADSAEALNMVITKDMLGTQAGSESLYLSEMSRNLAEFLTDDARGILRKEGGIMSLVDLWAVFNRARGGVELTSPLEFEKAARLWEKLNLPVRLRQFKNCLLVVQQADRTDDKTIAELLLWLQGFHTAASLKYENSANEIFGRGITAQEAAQRFGWSVGVATEELEMAEENGALCREEGVEGLRFWENWILDDRSDEMVDDDIKCDPIFEVDPVKQNLEDVSHPLSTPRGPPKVPCTSLR